jgi:hypothetical protein
MTGVSTFGVFVSDTHILVAGELIDGLIKAVVLPSNPRAPIGRHLQPGA